MELKREENRSYYTHEGHDALDQQQHPFEEQMAQQQWEAERQLCAEATIIATQSSAQLNAEFRMMEHDTSAVVDEFNRIQMQELAIQAGREQLMPSCRRTLERPQSQEDLKPLETLSEEKFNVAKSACRVGQVVAVHEGFHGVRAIRRNPRAGDNYNRIACPSTKGKIARQSHVEIGL